MGTACNERALFADAEAIRASYESAGFKNSLVKYACEVDPKSGQAKATFKITEGQ